MGRIYNALRELAESGGQGRLATAWLTYERKETRPCGVGEPGVNLLENPCAPGKVLSAFGDVLCKINNWLNRFLPHRTPPTGVRPMKGTFIFAGSNGFSTR